MNTDADMLRQRAIDLVGALIRAKIVLATAESCTGGMIAAALTDVPGSSAVLDRGFVTYSNAAKNEMLGVPALMIGTHGAVSEEVARAMAEGALKASRATAAVAVTGIAGPGGGTAAKPVGLVHLALATRRQTEHRVCRFGALGRDRIRSLTVSAAFDLIERQIQAGRADTP